jgi:hypothetical protein
MYKEGVTMSKHSLSLSSTSSLSNKSEDLGIDRKITLATERFTTNKFCELVLRDRHSF